MNKTATIREIVLIGSGEEWINTFTPSGRFLRAVRMAGRVKHTKTDAGQSREYSFSDCQRRKIGKAGLFS
jgi:hypothetical protein